MHPPRYLPVFALLLALGLPAALHAARIGELVETSWTQQAADFFLMRQPAVRIAVLGTALIGLCCGLLGSFLVARKLSLLGDTLSHAVLPGVAAGFLWSATKDPLAIFVGATLAGVLGVALVNWIQRTTHLKEDAAMGMVLAGFYGLGIVMTTMIQNMETGNKSGLDKFFFGQAAAMGEGDLALLLAIAALSLGLIVGFYKELLLLSFDFGFARASGLPIRLLNFALMALLAFAVVVSLQAVGVVLVSALLITPAASAYLLTDRMSWMLALATIFGVVSGLLGAFVSYLSSSLPTGPFIVLSATAIFLLALLFGPRHGILPRQLRRRRQRRRIARENTLKAVFHLRESRGFAETEHTLAELALARNAPLGQVQGELAGLVQHGLAETSASAEPFGRSGLARFTLTEKGWSRACQVVRNHRLWELYLTNAAHYREDHVHDDAEEIEHLLGEDLVRRLEQRLQNPITDPHGSVIPSKETASGGKS